MATTMPKKELIKNMRLNLAHLERDGDYWSNEDKDSLREMFFDGEDFSDICIKLQRTERAVSQQIAIMGLYGSKRIRKRNTHIAETSTIKDGKVICPVCNTEINVKEEA